MKKIFLIVGTIIFLLAGITYTLFRDSKSAEEPAVQTGNTNFPTENTIDTNDTEFTVQTQSGGVISVDNFLRSSSVVADAQNDGYFYLGNTFQQDESDTSPSYIITYIDKTQFFNVTLLREPLAESRVAAETYLKSELGISNEQMCALKYTVSVPAYINEESSGVDFRFSFCSDSTQL